MPLSDLFSFGFFVRHCSPSLNRPPKLESATGERISNHQVGALGEKVAARYVQAHKGKVLYKNYRGPKGGEVDLIVREGEILVFVEVKTRTKKSQFSRPLDAVDGKKRDYIIRGAKAWRHMLQSDNVLWRYDVIEVYLLSGQPPEVNWIKQVFSESR